jgi:hypothetical protein
MKVAFVLTLLALVAAVTWMPRRTLRDQELRKRTIRVLGWIAILCLLAAEIADPVAGILGP